MHTLALIGALVTAGSGPSSPTVPPCAACAAVVVSSESASSLPASLAGLNLLVRASGGRGAETDSLVRMILQRGGTPGLFLDYAAGWHLPERMEDIATAIVALDDASAVSPELIFDVKTQVTRLRAAGPVRFGIGLQGPDAVLRSLLASGIAPYIDFIASSERLDPELPWWRVGGPLIAAAGAAAAAGREAGRSLWFMGPDIQAASRALADLARAAAFFPAGLVPDGTGDFGCASGKAPIWLNPGTLDRLAWLPPCDAPVVSGATRERLSNGDLLVRMPPAAAEGRFADRLDVTASRRLSVAEIVARHQAAAFRQSAAIRTLISSGRTHITFEAPGFSAPVTIAADTFIYVEQREAGGDERTEVEQRSVRVNGVEIGGSAARLPLIDAERVAAPPLAIELTDAYTYALQGTETLAGTPCYVVVFEPAQAGHSSFKGRAWIAMDTFALVRIAAVQTGLRGPIVSSEQVDDFGPYGGGFWLLRRSTVHQIYEGAAHRTPIERVVTLDRHDLNAGDFAARRRAAHASANVMLRDTREGYRYLHRQPARGEAAASEAPERTPAPHLAPIRTVVFGALVDPNITRPLPFAGLSYVAFDLFGTGTQFSGFYGGTFGQVAVSVPALGRTRWQAGGRAHGIVSAFNDRSFRDGRERYDENIRQRPAHASFWLRRPLTPRFSLRTGYELDYTHYAASETTAAAFEVPASQVVHALRLSLDIHARGWTGNVWWSPAVRAGWRSWGWPGDGTDAGRHAHFQRYGAGFGRTAYVSPRLTVRGEAAWMAGRDLDRFSRYSFGAFDNRLRGYPAALIRYDRGGVLRGAIAWSASSRVRLDGFADAAFVRDPGFGSGVQRFAGVGGGVEAPGPFHTLLAAEWGYGLQGRNSDGSRGTHVFRLTAYRLF